MIGVVGHQMRVRRLHGRLGVTQAFRDGPDAESRRQARRRAADSAPWPALAEQVHALGSLDTIAEVYRHGVGVAGTTGEPLLADGQQGKLREPAPPLRQLTVKPRL